MKPKLLLLICAVFVLARLDAQNCTIAMSNTFFQQKLNQISAAYDADSRYNQARLLAQNNCMSSWQVKQVAMALYDDQDKLEFCKLAYTKVTDPANFYDVYDAFAYFSTAFRLHDFVFSSGTTVHPVVTPPGNELGFPVLPYPDYNQYLGATGCPLPVSEDMFISYAREMKNGRINDQAKLDYARNIVNSQCLSTSQIMKLATFITMENMRLDLLKAGIPRVYDRGNYSNAQHVLTVQNFRNDFLNALFGQPNKTNDGAQNTPPPCTVSQPEFDDIKKSVSSTSFASSKVTIAKQAVQAKKCFTVKQIKELLQLFSFDDNKLDMAKFCYDYCIDKSNYYQVNDVFAFSSSKDDLSNFVRTRQ